MKRAVSAGGVVLNTQKNVLLVLQKSGLWSLPKGHVKKGEDVLNAAKREIYEETGVKKLELIKEFGEYQRYAYANGIKELKTLKFFLFLTKEEALKPTDKNTLEASWVDSNDVCSRLGHEEDKNFFNSILSELQCIQLS